MATQVDVPASSRADSGRVPPSGGGTSFWRWGPSAITLLLGGLLTAAGGWLRWWGPDRLAEQTMRENDDANPLHMGWTDHVAPGSGELVASGQVLVAIGLILLLLLPWGRARVLAAPLLLVGAAGVAFPPGRWIQWWALGRPHADFPGWSPENPEWLDMAGGVAVGAWHSGLLPLLLGGLAAWVTTRPGRDRHVWRTLIPMSLLLFGSAMLVEYFFAFVVFLSDSHDDPVGTHVVSGLATAAAAGVLMRSGLRRRRDDVSPTGAPVDDRPRGHRWWALAGILLAISGLLGIVMAVAAPSPMEEFTPSPATAAGAIAVATVSVLAYLALAAGPWSGIRRVLAVGILAVLVVLTVCWTAMPLLLSGDGNLEGLPETTTVVAFRLLSLSQMGLDTLALVVVSMLLLWENAKRPHLRGGATALVVLASLVAHLCGWWLTRLIDTTGPVIESPMLPVLPGLSVMLLGAAWWWAARTGRSAGSAPRPKNASAGPT